MEISAEDLPKIVWPNGNARPMLQIDIGLERLSEILNIDYFKDRDDLDNFLGAALASTPLGPLFFQDYENAPVKGVVAYGDVKASPGAVADMFVRDFGIPNELFIWIAAEGAQ